MNDKRYTPTSAADELGISRERVRQLMAAGRIKYIMVGCRKLIERSAIDRYIKDKVKYLPGRPSKK
jgi:excisionase family DNA binding protein